MRNIVLITFDSLRADHCSFMGYTRNTTPTIDKMARKGLCFRNAVASGVPTFPSLVGIFTGDYSLNDSLSGDIEEAEKWREELACRRTLPQILRRKGYDTAGIHGNPWASRFYGFNKGFNFFQDFIETGKSSFKFSFIKNFGFIRNFYSFYSNLLNYLKEESCFITWRKIYPYIIEWLSKAKEPYFLWILLVDTHLPYIPPKEYRVFGTRSTLNLLYVNWRLWKDWRIRKQTYYLIEDRMYKKSFNSNLNTKIIDAYDSSIYFSDKFVKELWNDIKDTDPIIIITADHGEGFGEHGFWYHPPMLYEELIHVPLVIFNADIKGERDDSVSLVELAPTILDLVGIDNEFQSKSLLNEERKYSISKIFVNNKRRIAVRTNNWKLILGQKHGNELYDLRKDPKEQINLIDEHRDIEKELKIIVRNHIKRELEARSIREIVSKVKREII